jgi:hypothetical protein
VLTPPMSVAAMRHGDVPVLHASGRPEELPAREEPGDQPGLVDATSAATSSSHACHVGCSRSTYPGAAAENR